jgi:HEPN domain-containing protein
VFQRKRPPKIHDLDRLVKICVQIDPDFKNIKNEAKYLTNFYIITRYPGDYPEFVWQNAEQAYQAAKKIKEFVSLKTI